MAPRALALLPGLVLALSACGDFEPPALVDPPEPPEIAELDAPVTALAQPCTWSGTSPNGTVTVPVGNDEVAILSRAPATGNILVNGQKCLGGTTTANVSNTKTVNVTSSPGTVQTVIIDYANGALVTGTSVQSYGIHVTLNNDLGDALKFRLSSSADTVYLGKTAGGKYAASVNSDAYPDVVLDDSSASSVAFVLSAGKGNDVVTGQGSSAQGLPTALDRPLVLYGGEGDDRLTGGSVADTIRGGDGNDTINGKDGADTLYGDNGADTFSMNVAADGNDEVHGGTTDPAVAEADLVDYSGRTLAVTVKLDGTASSGEGTETDTLDVDLEHAKTGTGADTLVGNSSANWMWGGAGDDTLTGKDGNDKLYGEAGNDTFLEEAAANGGDTFTGSTGVDLVDYTSRTLAIAVTIDGVANDGDVDIDEQDNVLTDVENVFSGAGNDSLTGSGSANRLEGRDGNDTLLGGSGNDVLVGGLGDDTLKGEAGDDTFLVAAAADGDDEFWGGLGTDLADYSARTTAITVTMAGDGLPSDSTTTNDDGSPGELDNVQNDVENLTCPTAAVVCTVTGNDLVNKITGGAGNDVLKGGLGNDNLDGGGGDNSLDGEDGDGDFCVNKGTGGSYTNCEL